MTTRDDDPDLDLATELAQGLTGAARQHRRDLVAALLDDGFDADELRAAHAARRLPLLPLARALQAGEAAVPLDEAARRADVSPDLVVRMRRSLGLTDGDPVVLTEEDVDALVQVHDALAYGMSEESLLEVNASLASGMSNLAAVCRRITATRNRTQGDELAVARAAVRSVEDLLPLLVPVLRYALRKHLIQQVMTDWIDDLDEHLDEEAHPEAAVAFVDVSGFTGLTDRNDPRPAGLLNQRLVSLTQASMRGRTRLVKTIGDAVMLTAPGATEVLDTTLALIGHARDEGLGRLHGGLAHGPVLEYGGDVFGRTVNLASRLADLAVGGEMVCDAGAARQVAGSGVVLEERPAAGVRGIAGDVDVWVARPA